MHTGVIEILIITELKYVHIPKYVCCWNLYPQKKNPIPTPNCLLAIEKEKIANDPSVIRWFDSVETDTYFNLVF